MESFVVYDHPSDHPNDYVVRRWTLKNNDLEPPGDYFEDKRFERSAEDDGRKGAVLLNQT